ncbi:actin-binding lim protein 1-like protein [Plakobranchus ocellatus]|uniref:Actin-binding lim protein 1-like protein n=1 Tax=Plakobranchus ocellatus TaxID=259542 RepID=A0AAV4D2V0_9GAST|nr:actin-binding lim protein 1-like protein [Plakobranchus ocellatus]
MYMTSQISTAVNAVTNAKRAYRSTGATRPPTLNCSARCMYCGRQHEMLTSKCPAFGKECGKYHGRNHFASMCKSNETPMSIILNPRTASLSLSGSTQSTIAVQN